MTGFPIPDAVEKINRVRWLGNDDVGNAKSSTRVAKNGISNVLDDFEGGECAGGKDHARAWEDIWLKLGRLRNNAGSIRVEITDAPDVAPFSISVAADYGKYLVTLLETTDDETQVRSYSNPTANAEMVETLGNDWDARHLTGDFELVCRMVEEFYRTGDVSTQWLN